MSETRLSSTHLTTFLLVSLLGSNLSDSGTFIFSAIFRAEIPPKEGVGQVDKKERCSDVGHHYRNGLIMQSEEQPSITR